MRKRGRKILKKLAPEIATDRYFDAYKLLPRVDRFHRQMVRPMDLDRAVLVFESEMTTYKRRHAFLTRELKKNPLFVLVDPDTGNTASAGERRFSVVVQGRAGVVSLLVAEGECVAGPTLQIGNTNSRYQFSIGAKCFMNEWAQQGPAHHMAIGIGHFANTLNHVADLLGIECFQVC